MTLFSNKTIAQKLSNASIVFGVLFFLNMIFSVIFITVLSNNYDEFFNNEFLVVNRRGDFDVGNQGAAKSTSKMILAAMDKNNQNNKNIDVYYQDVLSFHAMMTDSLQAIKKSDVDSEDMADITDIEKNQTTLKQYAMQMHQLCKDGNAEEAWKQYETAYFPLDQAVRARMKHLADAATRDAAATLNTTHQLRYMLYVVTFIISIVMVLLLLLISRKITGYIMVPLRELGQASEGLIAGRIGTKINYDKPDEFGTVADTFRETDRVLALYIGEIKRFTEAISKGNLNFVTTVDFKGDFRVIKESLEDISRAMSKAMAQINISAEEVTRGAEQIASVGQSLSQSTVEQARLVTELATTINDVSGHVQENATHAMDASNRSKEITESVADGSKNLMAMDNGMHDMQAMTGEIAGIIKNIEAIAFQTNILSLNAAVEAARAGDAGRGFAVIAKEIRNLATSSSEASRNTSDLINKIIQMINAETTQAEIVTEKLHQIRKDIETTAAMLDQISGASSDQATSIAQIRQSINMISEVIQENSATAEESAASSEELMGQMKMLKQLVESFEFKKEQ